MLFGVELFAICGFWRLLLGFSGWCGRFVGAWCWICLVFGFQDFGGF